MLYMARDATVGISEHDNHINHVNKVHKYAEACKHV